MQTSIPVEKYYKDYERSKDRWWKLPKETIHDGLIPEIKRLREDQRGREEQNLKFERLYSNKEVTALRGKNYARISKEKNFLENRMTYNVTKSCVDAACAKISKDKPRPLFLTEGGNWGLQQRGKRLSQYVQGAFSTMGTGTGENKSLYGIGRQAFKDCAKFGTGPVYFFVPKESAEVKAERVFTNEILVDEGEAIYGKPPRIYREYQKSREELKADYPDHAKWIDDAAPSDASENRRSYSDEMIDVYAGWSLPNAKGLGGRFSICIDNRTLEVEDYKEDYFPFLFQRWNMPTMGFFGTALIEELVGIQLEISKILRTMRIAQHLCAVPQVWLEYQSKTVSQQVDNEIGGKKYYTGKPPLFLIPNAMNQEMYNHLEKLYQRAYEITGISQLSASGKAPLGIDAAVALRELKESENERFSMQQAMYEDFFMDATLLVVKMYKKLDDEGKKPVAQFKDGNSMQTIKFSEVYIDEKNFNVRAYPINFLTGTPAGKLQDVSELVKSGFYTQEEALELLDYPDLKKINGLKTSGREEVLKVIEKIIETEEYQGPEPFMNLQLAKSLSQAYYLRCKCDDAPEKILDLLRQFMTDVKAELDKQMPAPAPVQNVQTGSAMPAPEASLAVNAPIPPQAIAA